MHVPNRELVNKIGIYAISIKMITSDDDDDGNNSDTDSGLLWWQWWWWWAPMHMPTCDVRRTTTTMCVLCRLSSSAGDIRFRWNIGAINKYIAYLWAANIKRRSIKLILIIWPVHHSNWCMLFISSYTQLNSVQHNQWQRIIEHLVKGHRRKT